MLFPFLLHRELSLMAVSAVALVIAFGGCSGFVEGISHIVLYLCQA